MTAQPDTFAVSCSSLPSKHRQSSATRTLFAMARGLIHGRLTIVLPSGAAASFAGPKTGPEATLVIHDARAVRRFLTGGKIGFAESYIDGEWSSPDLATLIALAARNDSMIGWRSVAVLGALVVNRIRHLLNRNTRQGARRNIERHYDLGNDFYGAWLDSTMSYSAAWFGDGAATLAEAQRDKWRRLADMIDLRPGQRVLEIGCGWGGFAAYAAGERGCHVTGITLSPAQHTWARDSARAAGLQDRMDIRLRDYRDLDGQFDRIVSIEMLEAVGQAYWPRFFATLRDRLAPGGLAGLQVITIADSRFARYRRSTDFLQRYIFPGGMLPSPRALAREAARAGLRETGCVTFGADYARTLALWRDGFEAAWPRIAEQGFDENFRRMWRYYLAYCEGGFRAGAVDVRQWVLQRPLAANGGRR